MIRVIFALTLCFLFGCASETVPGVNSDALTIQEIESNKWTALTKQNLIHLAKVYDLSPFLYTRTIQIQSKVVPHSHPTLTLNTRYAEHPTKLLSMFLHEELHWWLEQMKPETSSALNKLRKIYPKAPAEEGGSADLTRLHLIVCYLELKALAFYIGENAAREVITSIMKKDKIFPWVYFQILYRDYAVAQVIRQHKLLPPPFI